MKKWWAAGLAVLMVRTSWSEVIWKYGEYWPEAGMLEIGVLKLL